MRENREEAIQERLLNHYDKYYRLAYSYVRNEQDAMDIVQESAYKAIVGQDKLKHADYAETWIYRIVVNTALDFLRKRKREQVGLEENEAGHEDIYQDFDVMDSLSRLEEKDRAVIILRYFEDMKLEDISRVTKENVNTVKSRLYRSLKRLKVSLENGGL